MNEVTPSQERLRKSRLELLEEWKRGKVWGFPL
jgi:hypothetical protein